MLKCSSFLPDLSAAASQRGVSPRPAQVSLGFSGLRYFGATGPRAPILRPLARNWDGENRESLSSSACRVRRSSATLLRRIASIWSLSFISLSIDIDFRFILDSRSNRTRHRTLVYLRDVCKARINTEPALHCAHMT